MRLQRLIVAERLRLADRVVGDAVLVEDGMVAAIGRRADLNRSGLPEDHYPGAVIIPGLRDAHFHPVSYAATLSGLSVNGATDLEDLRQRLNALATRTPQGPLVALRLNDELLAEGRLPTREDLDQAIADRPLLVHRYCGHIAVANTRALELAGVDSATVDPPGGTIDRDAAGHPTGILRETATDLVSAVVGDAAEMTGDDVASAMRGLAGVGLTSIGAIVGCGDGPWASFGDEIDVLTRAADMIPIKLGVFVVAQEPASLRNAAAALGDAGARMRWLGVKRFADGSFGGHTAWMNDPYTDRPDGRGTFRLSNLDEDLALAALELGGMVAVHAIGDAATREVIDLFERLIEAGADPRRLRMEHASILAEGDIARLARIGATASVQPAFLGSEKTWLEQRLGPQRVQQAYPLLSLQRAGVPLAGGSDCPVEAPHPLWGMALARDRGGINLEEGLSATQALHLFTDGAARSLREAPPLAVGSPADLVVLDRDPVESSPDELREAEVLDTWVDGEKIEVDRTRPVWAD